MVIHKYNKKKIKSIMFQKVFRTLVACRFNLSPAKQ